MGVGYGFFLTGHETVNGDSTRTLLPFFYWLKDSISLEMCLTPNS